MIKKVLSSCLVFGIVGFLLWNIIKNLNQVEVIRFDFSIVNVSLLLLCLFPIYFVNVLSWHLITKSLGAKLTFFQNLEIWMYSNLSRFIPGGFWQYPSRVYLLNKKGVSKTLSTTAVALEGIFNLMIGGAIVVGSIFLFGLDVDENIFELTLLFILFFLIILFIFVNQMTINWLNKFFTRIFKKNKIELVVLPGKFLIPICISFFFQYFFSGASLFFLTQGFFQLPYNLVINFIGIFTFSWLLGYITLFAPGGLGVQEISLASLMSNYMPFVLGSLIAIVFRILLYITEFITLVLIVLIKRFKNGKN